jgi:hypothetical protein
MLLLLVALFLSCAALVGFADHGCGSLARDRLGRKPSKIIYFEYLGKKAPYLHVVRQMEHHGLSREERQRVCQAYRAFQTFEDAAPVRSNFVILDLQRASASIKSQ